MRPNLAGGALLLGADALPCATSGWGVLCSIGSVLSPTRSFLFRLHGKVAPVPACGDRVCGDPVRGDPVRGDPVRGDPVRGDPVRGDPVRGDPVRGDPVRGDPTRF
jgi:hypothetical protein